MHANEQEIDVAFVRRLITSQFPQWAHFEPVPVPSAGTDNALYRLGEDLVVRLPRIERVTAQIEKEQQWLPQLAAALPIAIPAPLAKGAPAEGFPWVWSVYRWLPGDNAMAAQVADKREAARCDRSIQRAGKNPVRTTSVGASRSQRVMMACAAHSRRSVPTSIPSRWTPLRRSGLGVGDPACDLMVAWTFLDAPAREVFRTAPDVDDAAWARSRGWALSMALFALPYYRDTNPGLVAISNAILGEVLGTQP